VIGRSGGAGYVCTLSYRVLAFIWARYFCVYSFSCVVKLKYEKRFLLYIIVCTVVALVVKFGVADGVVSWTSNYVGADTMCDLLL
jgi:hypothetical protein